MNAVRQLLRRERPVARLVLDPRPVATPQHVGAVLFAAAHDHPATLGDLLQAVADIDGISTDELGDPAWLPYLSALAAKVDAATPTADAIERAAVGWEPWQLARRVARDLAMFRSCDECGGGGGDEADSMCGACDGEGVTT